MLQSWPLISRKVLVTRRQQNVNNNFEGDLNKIATNNNIFTVGITDLKDKDIHFHYMLNADKDQIGEFSLSVPISTKGGYTLGQRHAVPTENSFSGDIACLEFYHNPSQERFPLDLCMVISKNQKVELMPESQSLENGAKRKRVESGC